MIASSPGATESPPDPWTALGIAVLSWGAAFWLVWFIKRAYDRDPRNARRKLARPPWWRIRAIGYWSMTAVPMAFCLLCFGLSMIAYALFAWTGFSVALFTCALTGIAGMGCFLWAIYDSFGPRAWKRNGRDEYDLY